MYILPAFWQDKEHPAVQLGVFFRDFEKVEIYKNKIEYG